VNSLNGNIIESHYVAENTTKNLNMNLPISPLGRKIKKKIRNGLIIIFNEK
jgi:hypothetical protein